MQNRKSWRLENIFLAGLIGMGFLVFMGVGPFDSPQAVDHTTASAFAWGGSSHMQ